MKASALAAVSLLAAAAPVFADGLHGRALLQDVYAAEDSRSLAATLGERTRNDLLGEFRLDWSPRWGRWSLDAQYELSADGGDTPEFARREAALGLFPSQPPATQWKLSDTLVDRRQLTAAHRIDRLALGYTDERLALRAGRQALTWGAGLVFHPWDLFDPFAPDATDSEYKPGTDMLYGQYLFRDGSDIQGVAIPRPARQDHAPTADASSYAMQLRKAIGALRTTWMVARDHGDSVAGLAAGGPLGGAAWNAEVIPTFVWQGPTEVSALLNLSDALRLFGRDATLFAEYYHNGFGRGGRGYALSELPAPLRDRLVRGQIFNTGRDYLAAGAMLQLKALWQLNPTLIGNLGDASFYGLVQFTYSLAEDLNLVGGLQWPLGGARSEFGGIRLSPDSAVLFEQPLRLYLQVRYYF